MTNKLLNVEADVIINTVAISNIEFCETNPELAKLTNIDYAVFFAKFCKKHSIKFVQISTDHLFNGQNSFYDELSFKNPLNVYGKTKAIAEDEIIEKNNEALIIRTNFFGWGTSYRRSFSDFIIDNLTLNNKVHLYDDIYYTPIHINNLIDLIYKLIDSNSSGIFNIVTDDRISKYEFGILLCDVFDFDKNLIIKSNIEINKSLILRPKDMSLSNNKIKKLFNLNSITVTNQLGLLYKQFQSNFHNKINNIGK